MGFAHRHYHDDLAQAEAVKLGLERWGELGGAKSGKSDRGGAAERRGEHVLSGQLLAIATAWTATRVVVVVMVSTEHMERREAMVDAVAAMALEDRQYVRPLRRACAKLWNARLQRRNARLPHAQACAKLCMRTTSMRFVLPSRRVWLRAWDPGTSRRL